MTRLHGAFQSKLVLGIQEPLEGFVRIVAERSIGEHLHTAGNHIITSWHTERGMLQRLGHQTNQTPNVQSLRLCTSFRS